MLFGKEIPDSPNISVSIKIAIGRGHPILAWTGNPKTPEQDIIEDISKNNAVSRYLTKAIERGRISVDELGACVVPAYLCIIEDNKPGYEEPIQLTIHFSQPKEDFASPGVALEKLFTLYSSSIDKITSASTSAIEKTSVESAKILQQSATSSGQIMQAIVEPFKASLGLVDKAYTHESQRADKASDAVIRLLNSDTKDKSDIVDNLVKLAGAAPMLLAMLKELKKG